MTSPSESLLASVTPETWVETRVERFATHLCASLWHNEGHSSHSACSKCGKKWMRQCEIDQERHRLEIFTQMAEQYAEATGWIHP